MGEVYEAEHLRVGKSVAVKFMKGDAVGDRRALERFRREVRALSAITSEYVVTVLDCGEVDGETPYVVMERLHGEDLRHLLAREGPLSIHRAIRFALDACAGLSAVHEAGLVHRDLKPANLFVTRSKTRGQFCKILDFGVAKRQASDATSHGALLGTVRYMAPEQLSDASSVTAATDVYAVGAILFECLTGRPAHDADSPEELMFDILNREPPLATEIRPEVSSDLAEAIRTAMARRPKDRFQDVAELTEVLEALLPVQYADETARDESHVERAPLKARRSAQGSHSKVVVGTAVAGGTLFGLLLAPLGPLDTPDKASATNARRTPAAVVGPRPEAPSEPRPAPPAETAAPPITRVTDTDRTDDTRLAPSHEPRPLAQSGSLAATPSAATPAPFPKAPPQRAKLPAAPKASSGERPAVPQAVVLDVKNPYEE
jgi:serine/threonine-protein kinase